jgi:hypothetical protein
MPFKRKCSVCEFKGLDIEYFRESKKICDACIEKKNILKQERSYNTY